MIQNLMQAETAASDSGDGWVLPAKQARSRRLRDKILAAGKSLIEARNFDELTIADIADMAGCSAGAFYYRFKDKEAFFHGIVDQTIEAIRAELRRRFEPARAAEQSRDALCREMVQFVVRTFRDHGGLIRAAYVHSLNKNLATWQPIRAFGFEITATFEDLLAAKAAPHAQQTQRHNVRVAMQMIYATLINAVVNMPGPMQVWDAEMPRRLSALLRANLDVGRA